MAPATTKTFDAVEMSRRLRAETSRQLAGLSRQELLALLNSHLSPALGKKPTILKAPDESFLTRK